MEVLKILAAFAAGIGCGVFATHSYFSKKYKDIADEEIESMKTVLSRKKNDDNIHKDNTTEKHQYHKETSNYISSVPPVKLEITENPTDEDGQYEISVDEWLNDGFLGKMSLTYFIGDDALVDESGELADLDGTIGKDILEAFKEDDDKEIYVRNADVGADFEVIKDFGYYHER